MIIALKELVIKGTYLSILKALHDKHMTDITATEEGFQAFPVNLETKKKLFPFSTLIQYSTGCHSQQRQARKVNKRVQIGK